MYCICYWIHAQISRKKVNSHFEIRSVRDWWWDKKNIYRLWRRKWAVVDSIYVNNDQCLSPQHHNTTSITDGKTDLVNRNQKCWFKLFHKFKPPSIIMEIKYWHNKWVQPQCSPKILHDLGQYHDCLITWRIGLKQSKQIHAHPCINIFTMNDDDNNDDNNNNYNDNYNNDHDNTYNNNNWSKTGSWNTPSQWEDKG